MSFLARLSQIIEFAGYGPCGIRNDSLIIHWKDEIHAFPFTGKLLAQDLPCRGWQNNVSDLTCAALKVILSLDGNTVLENNIQGKADDLTITAYYLWLTDPLQNTRRVVYELAYLDKPLWAREATLPYDAETDARIWEQFKAILEDFQSNGTMDDRLRRQINDTLADLKRERFGAV